MLRFCITLGLTLLSSPQAPAQALPCRGATDALGTARTLSIDATMPPRAPRTPLFRFPGFASSAVLLEWLERRGITVLGADVWASDWNRMSPKQELALILGRIEANRGGIVLLHDTNSEPPQ
jgi:hypothetical protein